ncbi:hypothetical protein AAMO2058_000762800 [Amorphochlora amoebiformis]
MVQMRVSMVVAVLFAGLSHAQIKSVKSGLGYTHVLDATIDPVNPKIKEAEMKRRGMVDAETSLDGKFDPMYGPEAEGLIDPSALTPKPQPMEEKVVKDALKIPEPKAQPIDPELASLYSANPVGQIDPSASHPKPASELPTMPHPADWHDYKYGNKTKKL